MPAPDFYCRVFSGARGGFDEVEFRGDGTVREWGGWVDRWRGGLGGVGHPPIHPPIHPRPSWPTHRADPPVSFQLKSANAFRGAPLRRSTIVSPAVLDAVAAILRSAAVPAADDALWPEPDPGGAGTAELEVRLDGVHASLATRAGLSSGDGREGDGLAEFLAAAADVRARARARLSAAPEAREGDA